MNCSVCTGHLEFYVEMPIDAKKNEPTEFKKVFRCVECGSAMIQPLPSPDQVAEFYKLGKYYTQGESHFPNVRPTIFDKVLTKLSWWSDRATPFDVEAMAELLPRGATICDIGCGHGVLLERFRNLGLEVIGIDPDPVSRELAAKSGIDVLDGSGEKLPAALGQYDLVLMTHSLEHCIDPSAAIRNAYAVTKPGGYFYCEVPNCGCLHFEDLTVCSEMFDSPRHLWFFSASSLRTAIEKTPFHFVRHHFEGLTRHHSASWRKWEMTISNNLAARGNDPGRRHTFAWSAWLLLREAFSDPAKKYDCVGMLARKGPGK